MKVRKLVEWEALKLLQEQKYIENDKGKKTNCMHLTELERLFLEDWYEYKPEKEKSFSERFAQEYPIVNEPYIESSIDKCRVEFYNWLKQQEEE